MPLTPSTRLGVYEITAQIGVGGMGEVYRATDTNLKRSVAIKVLPASVAGDADRLARFQREAEVLAALNHPNIAAIYGLEKTPDLTALVMELVEGDDLSQRIARGAIPIDEALQIAKQIAEALEAAHEQGIIHRDLKPANIKVRANGTVKVLDFGLAKAMEPVGSIPNVSQSPTITTPAMTQAGVILGTAAYMSPEQAKGRPADKRSDVWAFGCVLYEMVTGARAFQGDDVSDTLAAVLRGEPNWMALPAGTPPPIRRLLRRCLEKDRKRRLDSAADARLEIEEALTAPSAADVGTAQPVSVPRRRIIAAASVALVAGLVIAATATWALTHQVPAELQPMRFTIVPPPAQPLALQGADRDIAISPDGTHIVYRAGGGGALGQTQLMVRALDELDARPLAGTNNSRVPFFSPDGDWVGFYADGVLKKVSITGGPTVPLCRLTGSLRGASWGPDDTIVFATTDPTTGLMSVPAAGGDPKVLTKPDTQQGENQLFPFVLPGGRGILFTIVAGQPENAQIAVLDLKTGHYKTLIRGGSDAAYVESGHLVYAAAGSLRAVPFDLARQNVVGDPVPVLDHLFVSTTGAGNFALSRTGSLVFVPGMSSQTVITPRSLVWVNRHGREEPIKAPARTYAVPRLSPDGARVALDIRDQQNDIWIWDLARQTLDLLTKDPNVDMSPVWTLDSRSIIWASLGVQSIPNLYRQAADGTGAPERLTTIPTPQFPTSSDGPRVFLWETPLGGSINEIAVLDLGGSSPSKPTVQRLIHPLAASALNPEISPDGHWLAYQSNESGQFEVYVRPFPKVDDARSVISTSGGTRPAWAPNGRELFYLDAAGLLTAVPIQSTASSLKAGNPVRLLSTAYYAGASLRGLDLRGYDVSRDGQRFLMIKENVPPGQPSSVPSASMVVVLNWLQELKAKVPTK